MSKLRSFAQAVEVIAMDGFAGYKTAAAAVVPDAVTVMDPFHVIALAGASQAGSDPPTHPVADPRAAPEFGHALRDFGLVAS